MTESIDRTTFQSTADPSEQRNLGVNEYALLALGIAAGAAALVAGGLFKEELSAEDAERLRQELDERQAPNPDTGKVKWDPADANDVLKAIEQREKDKR